MAKKHGPEQHSRQQQASAGRIVDRPFMEDRQMNETTKRTTGDYFTDKPIGYHPGLAESLDAWASACGWDSQSLAHASEQAIRTRHHKATIEHESDKARGPQPDIFTLSLGSVQVYYTVEPREVMIRGYGWEANREPLDDFDGGGFYPEPSW